MTDDEFKAAVMARFDATDRRFDAVNRRFDAVVARLDEQDIVTDNLSGKIDRLTVMVRASLDASERALTSPIDHGRRLTRLEHPQGGN